MTTNGDQWEGRLVRPPKSGRDYTSARGPDKGLNGNRSKGVVSRNQDLTNRFQNLDIRIDQLRMSTDNIQGRMEQFDTLNLNERLFKIERRSQQLGILTIVLAALLGLSILRDILHETGVDVTALVSTIASASQTLGGPEMQTSPLVTHQENALDFQTNDPK